MTGVVDGTLVPILTRQEDGHVYICRKGYAAINCQVICDHQGGILDIVARGPGSTHNSFVTVRAKAALGVPKKEEEEEGGGEERQAEDHREARRQAIIDFF